jgi:hypothetical protein
MAVQRGTGIAHLTVVPTNYEPETGTDTDRDADASEEPAGSEPEEPAPRTG